MTPIKHFAICIDDFGLHDGVNAACMALARLERVTAISCMVGAPCWAQGAPALRELPRQQVDIGLHLDLTEHAFNPAARWPLSQLMVRSCARVLDRALIRSEIHRQLDAFEKGFGRSPVHVDGHQHVHQFPVIRDLLVAALQERYAMLIEALQGHGYEQRRDLRRFQLVRQVPTQDGGTPIDVIVDFLMPRDAEIVKNMPPLISDFARAACASDPWHRSKPRPPSAMSSPRPSIF